MKIPGKATITNRSSTISSQFARARAPYIKPCKAELDARLEAFRQNPNNPECVYCGGIPTEWDHLFALVDGAQWTGYCTEINNLAPACGKCNQSRGKKEYARWMTSDAYWSPRQKHLRDGWSAEKTDAIIRGRIVLLNRVITHYPPIRLAVSANDTETKLEDYRLQILDLLPRAQAIAAELAALYQKEAAEILEQRKQTDP